MSEARAASATEVLSARQFEVAKLLTAGRSTREIAETLAISPRTVEVHVAAIFEKLGVRTRIKLASALWPSESGGADHSSEIAVGNLPELHIPLFGRGAEIADLTALVTSHPLVTLVGPGGIGKTQTSLHVAREVRSAFVDGGWFIDLAPLGNGDFLVTEIARILGITLPPSGDAFAELVRQVKPKHALLILDNCEHIIGPVATAIATLMRECGRLTILATSREPLRISGERTYRLPVLDVHAATMLFAERARSIDHHFVSTDENGPIITEICRKLDCMPLAIELAAARSNMFSPKQLFDHLEHRFAVLNGGRKDVLPRHQNMRALIDWSYDLLDEAERRILRRLSVFAGSFSIEGALAVSSVDGLKETDLLAKVSSLVDKSLVSVDRENEQRPFRLLESTRMYAHEKLRENGEANEVASQHLLYLRDLFVALERSETRSDESLFQTTLKAELGDVRVALDAALMRSDVTAGAELLAAIDYAWASVSLREGLSRNESFAHVLDVSQTRLLARLWYTRSDLLWRIGERKRAVDAATESVRFARESRHEPTLGVALSLLVVTSIVPSRLDEAEKALTECESLTDIAEDIRHNNRVARARITLARGQFELFERLQRQLVEESRQQGLQHEEGYGFAELARGVFLAGKPAEAIAFAQEAIALLHDCLDSFTVARITKDLAVYLAMAGSYTEALAVANPALEASAAIDSQSANVALLIELHATIAALEGDVTTAATLHGFVAATLGRFAFDYRLVDLAVHERLEAILNESLAPQELEMLSDRGAKLRADEAIALAKSRSLEPEEKDGARRRRLSSFQ